MGRRCRLGAATGLRGGKSEKTWREEKDRLGRALDGLMESVTGLDRGRLHEMVPGEHYPYSLFQMFLRVAYHNIYHAGQIVILRKLTLTI